MLQRFVVSVGCVAWLLGSATAQAQAWDTVAPVPPSRVDASPVALSPPDSRGFWAVGQGLVHYHADGSLDFARDGAFANDSAQVVTLADGSVVFAGPLHSYGDAFVDDQCEVRAVSAGGTLLWDNFYAQHGPSQFNLNGYCQHLGVDGGQGLWLRTSDSQVFNLAGDGAPASPAPVNVGGIGTFADFVPNPHGRGAYLLIAPARVVSVDRFGVPLWFWTDPDTTHSYQKIALGAVDGNLYLAGHTLPPAGGGAAGGLLLASVSASGTQRFIAPHAEYVAPNLLAFVPGPSGSFYLADFLPNGDNSSQLALQGIGADGSVQWSRTLLPSLDNPTTCSYFLPDCGLTVSPEGDALLIASQRNASLAGFFRYDAAGNQQVSYSLNPDSVSAVQALPNGNALLADPLSGLTHSVLLELDRGGHAQPAPSTKQLVADDAFPSAAAIGTDGSTYVVAGGQTHFTLTKIAADGSVAWINAGDTTGAEPSTIATGGDRVCVQAQLAGPASARIVTCFDAAGGARVWSTAALPSAWRVLANGSVIGLGGSADAPVHLAFDRSGTQLHAVTLPPCAPIDFAANGTLVCFTADFSHLDAYDTSGNTLYSVAVPAQLAASNLSASQPTLNVFDDGSTLVAVTPYAKTHPSYVWSVGPQGATRWVQALAAGSATIASAESSDTLYAIVRPEDAASTQPQWLQARALSDGSLRWQVADPYPGSFEDLRIDPGTGRVLALAQKRTKLGVTTLDPASGATLRSRWLPCDGVECRWAPFALGTDGGLRVAAAVADNGIERDEVLALHSAAATAPSIPVAQAGIDGAWYPAYASGQGFWIDYVASGNYLLMPWFTYDTTPLDDPSGLAWYSLQGSVPSGATGVDLGIGVAAPGTFDSGTVALTQVGTAHLSFSDCNSATLLYQFTGGVNGNAGGLMSLTRLTPSTADCRLADGGTAPAQIANVPANGFDARSSGTWYDPATSGQGLQLTIMPPASGFAGEVFGGWFTFDPASAANDPQHLQWFTLQGDLSNAANGRVTLAIAETLGGSLDGRPTADTRALGSATLTFTACDRATLDFEFGQDPDAHAFAGLSGSVSLSKIGGCAP